MIGRKKMFDKPYHQTGNSKLHNFGFQTIESWNHSIKNGYTGVLNNMKNEENWKKVSTEIKKFEKVGDEIIGTLQAIEVGHNYNNKVFKIIDADHKVMTVFGTAVLETQMQSVAIGDLVKIVFVGLQDNKKKGLNPVKMFEVYKR